METDVHGARRANERPAAERCRVLGEAEGRCAERLTSLEAKSLEATSLGVALRTEPSDLAISVDPVVGICLAGEAGDLALLVVRVVRQYFPVVV